MASLQTQTYEGIPGGMNLAKPAYEIADDEARYLQDVLLERPGIVRRRGPVKAAAGFATLAKKACGIAGTITPAGTYRVGVLVGDNSTGELRLLSSNFSTSVSHTWGMALPANPPSNPYSLVDIKPTLLGGNTIGTSSRYDSASPSQHLGFWRGSNSVTYSTGTIALTRGNAVVTGSGTSWLANASSGMFLFADVTNVDTGNFTATYVGTVKSVDSDTQITLVDNSPYTTAAGSVYSLKPVRGLQYKIVKGRITTSTSSTTVTGANTKFVSQAMSTGTWNLYRASDLGWIGKVTTINNEISLTLNANAALALSNERFVALRGDGNWDTNTMALDKKVGFLNAFYAGRQWYANNGQRLDKTSRVWFSDTSDPEGLDLSNYDGDFFDISSSVGTDTPIKAIIPAYNSLVVIKENETYAITGTSPTTFSVKKIQDDGVLSGMGAVAYGGGVIWPGIDGIYYYDGISVNNLTADKLGDYYKNAVRDIDPSTYRMWGTTIRGHYFLFMEAFDPSVNVTKGSLATTPTATTFVMNLETRAFVHFTNTAIRGAIETPSDTGKHVLYLANDNTKGNICQGFDLFDAEENDSILCDLGSSAGRYFYGQTALGAATTFAGVADTKYFSKITLGARAAVQSIDVYTVGQGGGAGTCNARCGIYSDVGGVPTALLGTSNVVALDRGDGPSFRSFAFSTPVELAPGDYWFGIQLETSGIVNLYQLATANGIAYNTDAYTGGLADPFGAVSNSNGPLIAKVLVKTAGPDFYIESKKYSLQDSMHKKMFKQLALNYIVQGDTLRLDTVPGLQDIGRTSTSAFQPTVYTWDQLVALTGSWDNLAALFPLWADIVVANFSPKRIKFIKRSQLMSFRLWQNSPSVVKAELGPFQIAYKWMRPGRT